MDIIKITELVVTSIAIFATLILGFIIFFDNKRSITNRTFLMFALVTVCLCVFNYLTYQFNSPILVLWLLRIAIFFAVWLSFLIFQLFYVFPHDTIKFPNYHKFIILPAVVFVSLLVLTPLVFSKVLEFYPNGHVSKIQNGPAIIIFGLSIITLVFGGIFILFKKMLRATGKEKLSTRLIFIGTLITFSLFIIFNFVLPVLFGIAFFVSFAAIFLLPFIILTFYAIVRHQLFSVKVIATELLVFTIWIIILIEALTRDSWGEGILEGTILLFVMVFGIFLIRSVRKEVSRREEFELLSKELGVANEKLKELDQMKTDFISIASHQLRTPLTAIKGYSSMILEGTYGDTSVKTKGAVDKIFQSAQRLIYIVNDLLDISRIEQGKFTLTLEDVKAADVLKDVVEELKPNAQKNNLDLSFVVAVDDAEIKIKADFGKIRQVFSNLIDNAIKYTPSGFVKVEFKSDGNNALISISDSGVGMSDVTIKNLFQKFSRAKGIAKMHTDGSGLGLYVAKQIIDAHHGRVWAESDGENKGSQFYVELPMG